MIAFILFLALLLYPDLGTPQCLLPEGCQPPPIHGDVTW